MYFYFMTTFKTRDEQDVIWFITFTCYRWLPLIEATDLYDDIYKWFDILKSEGHSILGYVIMPNHMHMLMYFSKNKRTINTCMAEGKKFRAWEIIKRLKKQRASHYLIQMEWVPEDHKNPNKQKFMAFELSFDCKVCKSEERVLTKLNYIHKNPVNKGYHLAPSMTAYKHSSAKYYHTGIHSAYPVEHYKRFIRPFNCNIDAPQ